MRKRRSARTAAALAVVPTPIIPPQIPLPRTSPTRVAIDHHHPTLQDVSQVCKLLLRFVPSELVDEILQQAEYWSRLISHVEEEIRVQARLPYEDVWRVYLASEPIPSLGPDGSAVRVERVRFELESHDQGWGGGRHALPYAGAWSWFDAVILSEAESHGLRDPVLPGDVTEIQDLDRRVYTVQCNRRADRTKRIHEVVWNRGECRSQKMDEDGAGNGFRFVESLKSGDRIALVARARYPGWSNNVYQATVEIFYCV